MFQVKIKIVVPKIVNIREYIWVNYEQTFELLEHACQLAEKLEKDGKVCIIVNTETGKEVDRETALAFSKIPQI